MLRVRGGMPSRRLADLPPEVHVPRIGEGVAWAAAAAAVPPAAPVPMPAAVAPVPPPAPVAAPPPLAQAAAMHAADVAHADVLLGMLPVLDADGADDGWADADADYAAVLGDPEAQRRAQAAEAEREAAEARAAEARLAALRVTPFLERDCPICLAPLGTGEATYGAVLSLHCHPKHAYHAACLRDTYAAAQPRCPECRVDATAADHAAVQAADASLTTRAAAEVARAAERVVAAAWAQLPPAERCDRLDEPSPRGPAVPGEWCAIDRFTVLDCCVSPCNHLRDVPESMQLDWAAANVAVFDAVSAAKRAGDDVALERALKWHLCLHDVLLRGPSRGTRDGRVVSEVAKRFEAWRAGRRGDLLRWWQNSRDKAQRQAEERRRKRLQAGVRVHEETDEDREATLARVLLLITEGELSRAMRLLHSLGIAGVTEGILRQLCAKHPERSSSVPAVLPDAPPAFTPIALTEVFRGLRKRAGVGPSGKRNEHLRALVGRFDDATADRVMPCYDAFANSAVRLEYPSWFYSAWAIAGVVPLVKKALTPAQLEAGEDPDARPIAIASVDLRAVMHHLSESSKAAAAEVLAPQQLAVGVSGGISVLVHGMRVMLEFKPGFVLVRADLKNAYNAISRATVLRRMAACPTLAHLVPFMHATSACPTDLMIDGKRLFEHAARGDSSEGLIQGLSLSSMGFCVGMHPELRALDAELTPFGGCARAIMDDVYAAGPPSAVFPALERFASALREMTGLEANVSKYECWSPGYDLLSCPWRQAAGIPIGGVSCRGEVTAAGPVQVGETPPTARPFACGVMVGGVPIGEEAFVQEVLTGVMDEIVSYIKTTATKLRDHPHHLWAAFMYSMLPRFDYWLRHCPPRQTLDHAARFDGTITAAAEALGYVDMLVDPERITIRRFQLPARMRGCGFRSRVELAGIAFCSCFVEAAEAFTDRYSTAGGVTKGLLTPLEDCFGRNSFSNGQPNSFAGFFAGGYRTARDFSARWLELQGRVFGAFHVAGPLDQSDASAGHMRAMGEKLQRAITKQIEQVGRDQLHSRIMQLPLADPRREAWTAQDRLSTQWVTAWPTEDAALDGFGGQEFGEVFATYLGRESPAVRSQAGRVIPCTHGSTPAPGRTCDPWGQQLGLATLPGGDQTACHDAIGGFFFELLRSAGGCFTSMVLEPRNLFTSLLPLAVMQGREKPGVVPDASMAVPLPNAATARGARRGAPLPTKTLLFDIKTVHGAGAMYRCARARDEQRGAVDERAHKVWSSYVGHARRLDGLYSQAGTTPIENRLRSFTQVRGLCFGQYGEASEDVHALIHLAASTMARTRWGALGARSEAEARGIFTQMLMRRLGVVVAREFARYRLRREPFIGTSRASVAARLQRGAPGMGGGGPVERRIPADAFYGAQQHQHAADVHFGIAGAAVRGRAVRVRV